MFIDCPHRSEKVRTIHNVHQVEIVEDMGISVPNIYASLGNKKDEFQSHMIEVDGKINVKPIVISIDLGASHSYIDPKMVERFHFPRSKIGKPWMVQLATGAKRKISEMIKVCLMNENGLNTSAELNIIPLGSYDCLIGMDWLDQHHVVLYCYKK
jgi:hypothetical protein